MSLLGERAITRRRYDGGAWVAGRWVRGAAVDTSFVASVQRLSGTDRENLSEGDRSRTARKVVTEHLAFLRTEDQHNTLEADDVLVNGSLHRVVHIDDDHPLIPHEMVFVVMVQETSSQALGIENDILSPVREWLIAQGVDGGIPNPDRAVIFANENGPRPPLPYVVVDVDVFDERIGYDEVQIGSTALVAPKGQRRGVVSVEMYGGSEVWVERATYLLNTPESLALLTALWLEPEGGLVNLSTTVDTDIETRYRRDFSFTYERTADSGDASQGVELEQVVHTDTLGDRVVVNTEDLP